jgi:cytochrome b subunit of formate dehydrogenase
VNPAFVLLLALAGAPSGGSDECLACHGDKDLRSEAGQSLFADAEGLRASAHGGLECADCHAGLKDYPHPSQAPKVQCGACHDDVAAALEKSAHGQAALRHDADAPACRSCHGPAHAVLASSDPRSLVAKKSLPQTCGSCHADPAFLSRHRVPFAKPVEAFRGSVHGRAVERGDTKAASCADCHGAHDLLPGRDAASRTSRARVSETCGKCHDKVRAAVAESVHGAAAAQGVLAAPVCTSCHGEHTILAPSEPGSLVNPARVSTVTCGRCHADERLAARFNLPRENVSSFQDSYHGLALKSGRTTAANCASCHGVHNILPSSDARSTVHPANLARTCGVCHPGAGERFAIGPVHAGPGAAGEHWVVRTIRISYLILIPLTVGFMVLHNLLDFAAKLVRGVRRLESSEQIERMNLHFRIAHWLGGGSFIVLVVTGFALVYPESWWAAPLVAFERNLALRGVIHRIAGVVLIASLVYHGVHLALVQRDRVILGKLLPKLKDATDLIAVLRYNLGLQKERPTFGMFSYAEKAEYWAFMWGSVVMAVTGFVLWFNNLALRLLPGWVSQAATAMHFYEAVLATVAIAVWHFYIVILDPEVYPMDRAWLTGKTWADHIQHTRPSYYRALVAHAQPVPGSSGGSAAGSASGAEDPEA